MGLEAVRGAIYRCHHCRACNLTDSVEIGWNRVCPTYEAYPFEHYAAGGRKLLLLVLGLKALLKTLKKL